MHPLLTGYAVSVVIPVQWGEMDAYGHVNNAVFFRYFESARIAYLEACGFVESMARRKIGAILHSTHCRFRQPLHYPDQVEIGARCTRLDQDRFTMEYAAVSLTRDTVAAEGGGVVVSFDYGAGRKVALPEAVRAAILGLDGAAMAAGGADPPGTPG